MSSFQGKNKFPVSEYDQYLSFVDVEKHPDWQEAWKTQDLERVNKILYLFGVDITNGWEIEVNTHRTRLTQQIEYGPRFSFSERVDPEWIKNGMSIEDQIMRTTDIALQSQLKSMNRTLNTGDFISYAKAHKINQDMVSE